MKKIGILTSGGDAPGMNSAARAVGRYAIHSGLEVAVIYNGYKGLVEGKIENATSQTFSNIVLRGGTFLGSARLPEFKEPEVRKKAIANLKKFDIDSLVVIGGDGSYMGALRLTEEGINCIGLPGTIDNDIKSTDYTIGFDTALNTIVDSIDKIRDTATSHDRISVIEVMGRHCGDLALFGAIATGADVVVTSENKIGKEELISKIKKELTKGKKAPLIIITEHLYNAAELAKDIEEQTNVCTRATVLGHIQRGGSPTAADRVLSARLASYAVELLIEGKGGLCVGIVNNKPTAIPIQDASKGTDNIYNELVNVHEKLI